MSKKRLNEVDNIADKEEKTYPIARNDNLYKKKIQPLAAPEQKFGVDVDKEFYDTLIAAAQKNGVDIAKLESFTQISQTRDQIYSLIDTMAEDSTIAAVLETYAEDATEANMDGRIVWPTSDDDRISKYIIYLLDTMNVDKNVYNWVYSLIKYGDLYLRLYRESEYNDKLFDKDEDEKEGTESSTTTQKLNETLANILSENVKDIEYNETEISKEDASKLDDLREDVNNNSTNILNEDVIIKLYSQNDRYVHYLEKIPNPAEMYELTRLGKSYAYIQAPTITGLKQNNDALKYNNRYTYSFKKKDVNLYEATEFVHAALEDNSSRTPEEVNIFLNDNDYDNNSNPLTYVVRRGQSLLYNAYKIWRELMLLEYSMLLNRVTKSSIIRVVGVEVGDMPKEQIGPHLAGIKSLMEQKAAIDVTGGGLNEYTNPGPIENNIYVPTHNGIGNISTQQIGGDVNVSGLDDIDYFKDKLFGALKVPKQFFGFTDDAAGFDAGTSLSIISSRYAKTIKRVQNTFIQALTDALNMMLIDKGLTSYVNKFQLHMVPPTTREEIDRQDAVSSKVQLTNDIMQLIASDVKDIEQRLRILRALLDDAISDPTVSDILQDEIDKYEELKNDGVVLDENGEPIEQEDMGDLTGSVGGDFGDDFGGDFGGGDFGDDFSDDSGSEGADNSGDLPTPSDLGKDFTQNV